MQPGHMAHGGPHLALSSFCPRLHPKPTLILPEPRLEPDSESHLDPSLEPSLTPHSTHPRPRLEPPQPGPVPALPLQAWPAVQRTDGLPVDAAAAQKLIHFYLVMVTATLLNGMDYRFGAHFQPEDFPSQA